MTPPLRIPLAGCLTALALLVLWPGVARAQRVAIESEGGDLGRRLAAELRGRGYDVELRSPEGASSTTEADALVWARDVPPEVRLCVVGAGALRCEELADEDGSVLLLQAIEVLRAHLGEPAPRVDPRPVEVGCPDASCPEPIEREVLVPVPMGLAHLELGAAPALIGPSSSLAAGVGVSAFATWAPDRWLGLELGGLVSLHDPALEAEVGSASFATRIAWLGVDLRVPEDVLFGHHLLIGVAAALAGAEVHPGASAPFDERAAALTAFMPMARASFVAHLFDRLRLVTTVRVGAALPQPVLVFDATEVGRWGAPFWSAELGLAAALDGR